MEEAPENSKESSNSAHANGMNKYIPSSETILWLSTNLTVADRQTCHPHNAFFFKLKRMPRN
jgi:hypothetical protein